MEHRFRLGQWHTFSFVLFEMVVTRAGYAQSYGMMPSFLYSPLNHLGTSLL